LLQRKHCFADKMKIAAKIHLYFLLTAFIFSLQAQQIEMAKN